LYFANIVLSGNSRYSVDLTWLTTQVHGHNRARSRGYTLFDLRRVDPEVVGLDINEHWLQIVLQDDVHGGHERDGWHNHFVTVPPAASLFQSMNRDLQR
jgi:hypothetical protein